MVMTSITALNRGYAFDVINYVSAILRGRRALVYWTVAFKIF